MNVTPSSMARWMVVIDSSQSACPYDWLMPIHPRPCAETSRPLVLPRVMRFMCSAPFCREAASVDRDLGVEQLRAGVDLGTRVKDGDNRLSGRVRLSRVHPRPPGPGPKPGGLLIGAGERPLSKDQRDRPRVHVSCILLGVSSSP